MMMQRNASIHTPMRPENFIVQGVAAPLIFLLFSVLIFLSPLFPFPSLKFSLCFLSFSVRRGRICTHSLTHSAEISSKEFLWVMTISDSQRDDAERLLG